MTANFKKILLIIFVSFIIGLSCSLFLQSLDAVTQMRLRQAAWIFLLPIAGLLIGWIYEVYGDAARKGNHLLIQSFHQAKEEIPLKMSGMIFGSTLLTHLVGGSAGREGTAVQMGGSIAFYFKRFIPNDDLLSKQLIIVGISAGFAGVFGTPLAASIFALEVIGVKKNLLSYVWPSLLSAFIAHNACIYSGALHTTYTTPSIISINLTTILQLMLLALAFALTSRLFVKLTHLVQTNTNKWISNPIFRPALGGMILLVFYLFIDLKNYQGLGIENILDSFKRMQGLEVFAIKILLTAFTLGVGFKGGEVTPLFFIGATLGSALSLWIPLPLSTMAALGFTAVFAASANTPLACTLMAIELFGLEIGMAAALVNYVAYFFSDKIGIYHHQEAWLPKLKLPL